VREADIEQQNLVTVSSILPPGCIGLERDAGVAFDFEVVRIWR
jgi:pyruvoyl-dependent arginine decarboxylase (PvlArgDC)